MSEAQTVRNTHHTQTHSGKMFDIFNPRPEDICIEDIAHALAMQCRFNGHTKEFYSVAEHSLNCARISAAQDFDTDFVLRVLLHDAHEAYLGDIPGPWVETVRIYNRKQDSIHSISVLQRVIDRQICASLGLEYRRDPDACDLTSYCDMAMLQNEKRLALAVNNIPWSTDSFVVHPEHMLTRLDFHKPAEACFQFLKAYQELTQCLKTGSPVSSLPVLSLSHLRT